jgi:hypothetical protein
LFQIEVLWGADIISKINTVDMIISKINHAIDDHLCEINPDNDKRFETFEKEEIKRILIAKNDPSEDDFFKEICIIFSDIENSLKQYIVERYR